MYFYTKKCWDECEILKTVTWPSIVSHTQNQQRISCWTVLGEAMLLVFITSGNTKVKVWHHNNFGLEWKFNIKVTWSQDKNLTTVSEVVLNVLKFKWSSPYTSWDNPAKLKVLVPIWFPIEKKHFLLLHHEWEKICHL